MADAIWGRGVQGIVWMCELGKVIVLLRKEGELPAHLVAW